MPMAESLMESLRGKYGAAEAERIYWGMVGEGKGPFAPGGKYRKEHESWAARNGVAPAGKKKPRSARKRKRGSLKGRG